RPSFRGRFKSSTIRSGRGTMAYGASWCRQAMASSPSLATLRLLSTLQSLRTSWVRRMSPALSSTSKICIGSPINRLFIVVSGHHWDREQETRAVARLRLGPDPAAVAYDNLLADRQTDASTG